MILPACLATPQELAAGVCDVEGLCHGVANAYLARRGAYLSDDLHGELYSYLMLAAWTEAAKYRPHIGTLVGFLTARLRFRCVDWYRSYFGRSKRERPVLVSLDDLPVDVAAVS